MLRWARAQSQHLHTSCDVQDVAEGVAAGIGASCAEPAGAFFGPSSQLNLLVLNKIR